MSVEVEGLDGVLMRLNDIAKVDGLTMTMGRACAVVERSAKQKAPKDKGELRRSITSRVDEKTGEIRGVIYTPLEYAPYVEFGTGLFAEEHGRTDVPWSYQSDDGEWHTTTGQKPQPFLRPALEENRTKIKQILKGGLNND